MGKIKKPRRNPPGLCVSEHQHIAVLFYTRTSEKEFPG